MLLPARGEGVFVAEAIHPSSQLARRCGVQGRLGLRQRRQRQCKCVILCYACMVRGGAATHSRAVQHCHSQAFLWDQDA